jgi:uncharacterized protein involved in response to NO
MDPITNMMSVSEINQRFPQCGPVFNKYGLGGCGGEFGPNEPLFIFAAAHHVPLKELVVELNQAARGEWKDDSPAAAEPPPSPEELDQGENLYKRFVFAALFITLTLGTLWGVINMTRIAWEKDYAAISGAVKQAHGHEQIFGFVGLFIMGVAFHAVPRFKMTPLRPLKVAKACFALMLAGVLLRAVSQPLAANRFWSVVLVGSALLELAAIGLFAWLIARVVRRSGQASEFYEKFIWASVTWLTLLAVANAALAMQMFAQRSTTVGALANSFFIHVALFGFISNMIFAFSFRILPHFMGLRDSKVLPAQVAFWLWNAAIVLRYPVAWQRERPDFAASVAELVAVVLIVWAVGLFAKRRVKIEIQGVDNAFTWFIYLGFFWLIMAAIQPFHADLPRLTASARHAMTVGFIMSMLLGVSHRVLPIFNGVNLHSNRALRLTFWLLLAGSSLTLAMAYSARREQPWMYTWTGVAGWLVFAAVVVAAWNLFLTLRVRAEPFTRGSEVKPGTRVTEMLEVWPDLRPVLIHNGLTQLARMRGNPPRFVTIEFAARRHGIDPQPLVKLLNEEITKRKAQ